jgi:hypothetical protein
MAVAVPTGVRDKTVIPARAGASRGARRGRRRHRLALHANSPRPGLPAAAQPVLPRPRRDRRLLPGADRTRQVLVLPPLPRPGQARAPAARYRPSRPPPRCPFSTRALSPGALRRRTGKRAPASQGSTAPAGRKPPWQHPRRAIHGRHGTQLSDMPREWPYSGEQFALTVSACPSPPDGDAGRTR